MGEVLSFEKAELDRSAESDSAIALPKSRINIAGHQIAYATLGEGKPIVFVHGNYLSSRMWRSIIPSLAKYGRCIAIDLPGFGASDSLKEIPACASHIQQQTYLFRLLMQALDAENDVTLVVHGIGSILGCDWAFNNQGSVRSIVYTNGIFVDKSRLAGGIDLERLQEPDTLDYLRSNLDLLKENISSFFSRPLNEQELSAYSRRLYVDPEGATTVLNWVKELPCWGKPEEAQRIVAEYSNWMRFNKLPKLWVKGAVKPLEYQRNYDLIAETFTCQRQTRIEGGYVLQEDRPKQFARILKVWLDSFNH